MNEAGSPRSSGWSSVAPGHRRILILLWAIFLLRAGFYLSFTPLWEGFDEHPHFAYIQLMSVEGRLPVGPRDRISREIHSSLELAPLPWQPGGFRIGLTHDDYWKLDPEERKQREERLRALDLSLGRQQTAPDESNPFLYIYQGQHPPLYYTLCLIPYRFADQMNLIDRVFLVRAFTILLASGLVPVGFFFLRRILGDRSSLLVLWVIVFFPGLMFDVVRVGNESLAVLLFTLLVSLCVRGASGPVQGLTVGLILGLGLLTKSSLMTAVAPVAIALLVPSNVSRPLKRRLANLGLAALAALAVTAWWYVLNLTRTGNWSGLYLNAAVRDWSIRQAAVSVDWLNAFQTILSSHVWFGNWSFLKLRGWMYQLVTVAFLLGIVGAGIRLVRGFIQSAADRYHFLIAGSFYAFFWIGLAYYMLLTYVTTGVSAVGGWYLSVAVVCEILVLFAGWTVWSSNGAGATRVAAAAALATTLMDLYGAFFLLIPYYTGFISHDAAGSLSSFKPWTLAPSDYLEMISRLGVNKPNFMTAAYFLGSTVLFFIAGIASLIASVWFLWQGNAGRGDSPRISVRSSAFRRALNRGFL